MNYTLESCPLTLNTTRICARDPVGMSIEVSKVGFSNMKPNAVILANKEEIFDAIAATSLVHFPINAALLFTDGNNLSGETLKEIQRLSPKGYKGVHVILIGNISKKVSSELNYYGFRTCHIAGRNHYETACMIARARKEFKNILIMSGDEYAEGIISGYWSAHHGDPILFVKNDKIPVCAVEVIKRMRNINIYIIGSGKTVSKEVEHYLSQLECVNHLDRISGDNPYEIAVNFAKYTDSETEFGWGRNYREGHAFTFGVINEPMHIIAGALFAHMGKHTPPLLIGKDRIPEIIENYIKSVKPMPPKNMPKPPFMHGFILGATQDISYKAQLMIEGMLSIDHEMHGMANEMMNMNNDMMDMHHKMMKNEYEMDGMYEQIGMENNMDKMMGMHNKMMMDEHEMDGMHEQVDMENDMDKMMEMHQQMMKMNDGYSMEPLHQINIQYMQEEDTGETTCNCNKKMSKEYRVGVYNNNYKKVSIDEILE